MGLKFSETRTTTPLLTAPWTYANNVAYCAPIAWELSVSIRSDVVLLISATINQTEVWTASEKTACRDTSPPALKCSSHCQSTDPAKSLANHIWCGSPR